MAFYWEDFEPDTTWTTPGHTVTETDIALFSGLSGDHHELHTDDEWVKANTDFGGRIAHGQLGLSLATGLSGRLGHLAGTSLAFVAIENWRFLGPIKIGDTIHVDITLAEKRETSKPDRGIIKRRFSVKNQRGELVQDGLTVTLVKRRPANA